MNTATAQVFAKTEQNGDVVVGLFNTTSAPEVISTTAAAVGLPSSDAYLLNNLWTHHATESGAGRSPPMSRRTGSRCSGSARRSHPASAPPSDHAVA